MKIQMIGYVDMECTCRNKKCKKDFVIEKERLLEDYRQCPHCGSLKWDWKDGVKQSGGGISNAMGN